jgi:hypothetical protein
MEHSGIRTALLQADTVKRILADIHALVATVRFVLRTWRRSYSRVVVTGRMMSPCGP